MHKCGLFIKTVALLSIILGGLLSEASERPLVRECGVVLMISGDGLVPDRLILQVNHGFNWERGQSEQKNYVLTSRHEFGQTSDLSESILKSLSSGEEVCLRGYSYEKGSATAFIPLDKVSDLTP